LGDSSPKFYMSKVLLDHFYKCGDKKFLNIWQAFDHQLRTKNIPNYILDEDFVALLKNSKRPKNLSGNYIKSLIIDRLKQLRKQYRYLRLSLGGGTDSYSLLKYCVQNDIYLDEVYTHMVSLSPNTRMNLEFIPALNYAKSYVGQTIGSVIQHYPSIKECEFILEPGWYKNLKWVRGSMLPIRGVAPVQNLYKTDLPIHDTLTIYGFEKPYFIKENGIIYWIQLDPGLSELMGCENALPLFFDKECPEIAIAMAFAMLEHSDLSKDFIGYDVQPALKKQKILHEMGLESTGHFFIDHHTLGKSLIDCKSKKNIMYQNELVNHGRHDIVDAYFKTHKLIIAQYKKMDHAIEIYENDLVKPVSRISQKIPVYQDFFGS